MRHFASLLALVCSCGGAEYSNGLFNELPPSGGDSGSERSDSGPTAAGDSAQDALGRVDDGDAPSVDAGAERSTEPEGGAACDLSACHCTTTGVALCPVDGGACRCGYCPGWPPGEGADDAGRCI